MWHSGGWPLWARGVVPQPSATNFGQTNKQLVFEAGAEAIGYVTQHYLADLVTGGGGGHEPQDETEVVFVHLCDAVQHTLVMLHALEAIVREGMLAKTQAVQLCA